MGEVLTADEINVRYPDQWVLVADPVTDEHLKVQSGRVAAASKNRDEVYNAALTLSIPRRFATLFTGELPPDMVVVL